MGDIWLKEKAVGLIDDNVGVQRHNSILLLAPVNETTGSWLGGSELVNLATGTVVIEEYQITM